MIDDKTFPFASGDYHYIKNMKGDNVQFFRLSDYENNVSSDNNVYTKKERLQFTLDLFISNGL